MWKKLLPTIIGILLTANLVGAQTNLTPQQEEKVNALFKSANTLSDAGKPAEALKLYKEAIAILPDDPALLYNAGMSAYMVDDFSGALAYWQSLKKVDPADWMVRAKLVQTFQALNRISDRDAERAELFAIWKSKENAELSKQDFYCREQFTAGGYKIMVLEHFELKGDRALRYAFMVTKPDKSEEFRITLGSYAMTNAVWRETTEPKPKEGDRLFHIDGYYKWGHATIGMYHPEPSYEETRAIVVKTLEGKQKPISSSTVVKTQ